MRAGTASQRIVSVYLPEKAKKTQMIAGAPAEAAATLVSASARRCEGDLMILVIAEQRDGNVEPRDVGSDCRGAAGRRADQDRRARVRRRQPSRMRSLPAAWTKC